MVFAAGLESAGGTPGPNPCLQRTPSAQYLAHVDRALRSGRDLWGEALVSSPEGPTYEGARRYLSPLLFAKGPKGRPLTDSGFHYVAFGQPMEPGGAGPVALHVADGSQVISERVGGRSVTVDVGGRGRERYGSCLARLTLPRLSAGYLPILQTEYIDAAGVRYRQESFATRIPQTSSLVSFVRLVVDARSALRESAQIRLTPSVHGLRVSPGRLIRGADTYLLFSPGGSFDGASLRYAVRARSVRTVYAAWLNEPAPIEQLRLTPKAYEGARRSTAAYWQRRLAGGATYVVPERRVLDAERSLLVQNLTLTWRYSIGNPYEEFSFPESVDVAQVMSEYGFAEVGRAILRTSLQRKPTPYPNWKMGEKLVASALYYRLFADRSYVDRVTPVLSGYVDALGRQLAASARGILQRERYSSDIPDSVYGFHSQAVAWQGLRAMGQVWAATGNRALAARCRALAKRLEAGLRKAVRDSDRRLADGSLFVPARLLDPEPAHQALTASRSGSYWNLVVPYALASGFFAPGGQEARGVLDYLSRHGARLLGLVRAAAFALYRTPVFPTSGTDQVYGINAARFLADNGQADQLVLSLYGHLAAGMTPGTFVSGEAASVASLARDYYRSMYLPPNGASNAAFLETLRLMLVHETRAPTGEPSGLELATATPRAWLRAGRQIVVRRAPTSFGPISYSIRSRVGEIRVSIDVPVRAGMRRLTLRLRVPRGARITGVVLNGRPFARFDPGHETIDLSSRRGRLELVVRYGRS